MTEAPESPPPRLSEAEIERRYRAIFDDEVLARGELDQALDFVADVAASLPIAQRQAFLDNFQEFLQKQPTEDAVWQSLEPIARNLRQAHGDEILQRHEARVVGTALDDFVARVNAADTRNPEALRVVFVAHKPYFTILRIALHLREKGHRVFLACLHPVPDVLAEVFDRAFDARVVMRGARLMRRLLGALEPDVFHIQCFQWNYWLGRLVIENKGRARVVGEFYDVTSLIAPRDSYCRRWPAERVDMDFAMEAAICRGADVVITRLPEALNSRLRQRWGAPARVEQFWPYPSPAFAQPPRARADFGRDATRVVFPGNIIPRDAAHPKELFPQFGLLDVCEKLLDQGLHVDLLQDPHLPIDPSSAEFADYGRALERFPHFRILPGVSPDQLAERLADYDFALMSFRFFLDGTWLDPDSIKYGMGTRMFTYLEAGLPIIMAAESEYMAGIVAEHGLGLVVSWEKTGGVAERIADFDYAACLANIERYNARYGMDRQIGRLIELYRGTASE